jgi:hypothetical protein
MGVDSQVMLPGFHTRKAFGNGLLDSLGWDITDKPETDRVGTACHGGVGETLGKDRHGGVFQAVIPADAGYKAFIQD